MFEVVGFVDPSQVLRWLESSIKPHLRPDVSNYAKGRLRVWLGTEPTLMSPTQLLPGLPVGSPILDRLQKLIGWNFDFCLVTYSGDNDPIGISPHRDASYADYEAWGWNISGECEFSYWMSRSSFGFSRSSKEFNPNTDRPTHEAIITPGQVVRFNCKNLHAARPTTKRWNLNFWKRKETRT